MPVRVYPVLATSMSDARGGWSVMRANELEGKECNVYVGLESFRL